MSRVIESIVGARRFTWLMVVGVACSASGAMAQTKAPGAVVKAADPTATEATASNRSNLSKMFRTMTTEFNENKLEDVMKFIEEYTGATIETHWAEGGGEGLNKEQAITLKVKNLPALTVLERVLNKATGDLTSSGNTWQMTEYGAIEVGPKSVLNKSKRVELYDIHDLMIEIPRYAEVPQIDLQSLLQQSQSGGGGGGQSPFRNDQEQRQNGQRREGEKSPQEKADDIVRLITTLVEPEEWVEGGGEGGTIRVFEGNILVNAPDYMHRQINGYPYWTSHTSSIVGGRRYVSLTPDQSIGKVKGFAEHPVTAVVGGKVVRSEPGGSIADPTGGAPAPVNPGATTTTPKTSPKKTTKPAASKPDDKK